MKKISLIIVVLLSCIIAVTYLYFKNLSSAGNVNERALKVVPKNASLIFEYNNENYFYDIFKDFGLFKNILGKKSIDHLSALKQIFVNDDTFSSYFVKSELFFSIHQAEKNNAEILLVAPLTTKDANEDDLISLLKSKFKITETNDDQIKIYQLAFNNKSTFNFFFHDALLIGSFDAKLLEKSKDLVKNGQENDSFKVDFRNPRNKNSIANLYISFAKLPDFLNNFSDRKNPNETFGLKSIDAFAALNINYQSNAFMFSGITTPNLKAHNYFNLFLGQQPGVSTLINNLPYDAASYSFYYTSNYKKFRADLVNLLQERKEWNKLKSQLDNISSRHSINLDKELMPVIGTEFGVFQLASGEQLGIIKSNHTSRLSFLLSTISSEVSGNIRHLDDSYLLYAYFGDPFKAFRRPYYASIENHLVFANNIAALNSFLKNYNSQNFLTRTDKNLDFQQYLSNQGNIFYFIHNSNSKAITKSFLSRNAYKGFKSDNFNWDSIYGMAIQFSADKDKYFTNLYMNRIPEKEDLLPELDSTSTN